MLRINTFKAVRPKHYEAGINLAERRTWFASEQDEKPVEDDKDADTGSGSGEQNQKIDWSTIDVSQIPEDVIKQHTAYKQVLDESVQRRKEIKKIKGDQHNKPTTKPKADDSDEDVSEIEELRRTVLALRDAQLKGFKVEAAKTAGLDPAKHLGYITGDTLEDMITSAKQVAADFGIDTNPKNADQKQGIRERINQQMQGTATNPAKDGKESAMGNKIKARLSGSNMDNPFSPGVQRLMGGGPLIHDVDDN